MQLSDIEQIPLKDFSEKSYLGYSMYVILDRALPFIGDGLKPVQRRIIYAMSELGLQATAKFKKSARTVGDVIGKFHPHGDSAAYEAMVLMAQPFSYRYPLIDGQGNWGSIDDPKSFAAMRYTESKLHKYADLLLSELKFGTVSWQDNFDASLQEPVHLPARLPNVLINGSSGIAVGMSTDIPPHNLSELATACIYLLENPNADLPKIMQFIKAPDFPTEAEIISSKQDIFTMYQTGNGSIKMRANWNKENGDIVISALPHQASGAKIIEQIATQMRDKKLPMIDDLRDESDHKQPIRLIIIPRSNRVDIEQLMLHLFATTDLEKNIRVNLNMIGIDGKPRVKGLVPILNEWLQFRADTIKKRLNSRLEKLLERLHILDGLLIAYLNIDEVIKIIREFDEPKLELIARFGLTEIQVKAVLELKLRQLAKLEEIKIKGEQNELSEERQQVELILGSDKRLKNLVKKEISHDSEMFGDNRRSKLTSGKVAVAIDPKSLVPNEPITIVLSEKGWIRAAKGHENTPETMNYKSGDSFLACAFGKTSQNTAIIDSFGKVYTLPNNDLPSARGQGEPLTGKLSPQTGANFAGIFTGNRDDLLLVASNVGYGFVAKFSDMSARGKAGKSFLNMPYYAKFLSFNQIYNLAEDLLVSITNEGRMLIFNVADLPQLPRGKGNKIIALKPDKAKAKQEFVVACAILPQQSGLKIYSGKQYLNLTDNDLIEFKGNRGSRGKTLPRGYQRVERLQPIG